MVNSEKRQSADDRFTDPAHQNCDGEESVETPLPSISRRLTENFLEDGDGDLLLQRSDKGDGLLQWLQALDMQVVGACRADERLKPLLKLNISGGEAEDRLLAQLGEHFEPSEVGLLARWNMPDPLSLRCLRLDMIVHYWEVRMACGGTGRGNLCLTLLPTSDLRISFNGDDGYVERLAMLSSEAPFTDIEIQEIAADKTGRSFVINTTDGVVHYFWCSEKYQLLGNELLEKMKDLLVRRPSLAELTGINDGRLNSFATDLRAYLGGSISAHSSGLSSNTRSHDDSSDSSEFHFPQFSFTCESMSYLPESSSKVCLPESSSFEKLMARGEDNVLRVDSFSLSSTNSIDPSSSNFIQKLPETNGLLPFAKLNFIDAYGKPADFPLSAPNVQLPSSCPSNFSPHYCWCPPLASTLDGTLINSQHPILPTESLRLPPLSSKSPLNLTEVPMDFPSFAPDPFIRLPTSQQTPTFTPLMCDPIVHIPIIDVFSSGPGYLVSVGPGIAPAIPPLNPNLVDPLLKSGESVVEKSARDTLRMLIGSTNQTNLQLLEVLPSVLGNCDDKKNAFANIRDDPIDKNKPFNSGFDSEM